MSQKWAIAVNYKRIKIIHVYRKTATSHVQWHVTIIFAPPPANIRYGLTVLIHSSGHFGPPLPFWALGSGLPMASYATGHVTASLPPCLSVILKIGEPRPNGSFLEHSVQLMNIHV